MGRRIISRWKPVAAACAVALVVTATGCAMTERMTQRGSPGQGTKVMLSGSEEVPPISTSGSGSGTILVAADGTVSGSLRTTGFTPTMGHIHLAPRGSNGPVVVPLTHSGDGNWAVPAGAKLTEEQLRAYKDGNLYVNVHSAKHPGGEIRGQLRP